MINLEVHKFQLQSLFRKHIQERKTLARNDKSVSLFHRYNQSQPYVRYIFFAETTTPIAQSPISLTCLQNILGINNSYVILFHSECGNTAWGPNCSNQCGHCANGVACNTVNGICHTGCEAGYIQTPQCNTRKYGLE